MPTKNIGVVVIGKDEGVRLKRSLESLLELKEVTVYVDSQSSDGSAELATAMGFHVLVLDDSKPVSRPRARNEGFTFLESLNLDISAVHFLDGDTTLSPGWLQTACDRLSKEPAYAIVCGKLEERNRDRSVYRKLCDIEWYRVSGELELTGGIVTIRTAALKSVGGYNETIRGEDYELCRRLRKDRWKIYCINKKMGVHDSGLDTLGDYWKRGVKGGHAYLSGKRWGKFSKERKSVIAWSLLLPMTIVAMLFINPVFSALGLVIYPAKVIHIAYKNRYRTRSFGDAVLYGGSCIFIKFAQCYGIIKFHLKKHSILSD